MSSLPVLLLLFFVISTISCLPFYSKRELAPSLTLQRLSALKDSIDQLNDIKKQIRCQEKAQEMSSRTRSKRMISPSLRLSELIDPLVADPLIPVPAPNPNSNNINNNENNDEVDPCVAFYNDVPYYF